MSEAPSTPEARQSHWDERYGAVGATGVSWYEDVPAMFAPDSRRGRRLTGRAVFHFLTSESDRGTYRRLVRRAVEPGGLIVVATFDVSGPEYCSGLPVVRYDADGLAAELGSDLEVVATGGTEHHTPSGAIQPFRWVALRR